MDQELSLDALARMIVADVVRAHPSFGPGEAAQLTHRLETALRTAVRQERLACVAECDHRRTLWTETEERSATAPSLTTEVRFRANEAAVLGDALRSRQIE